MRIHILEVDKLALILAAKGPEFAAQFATLLASLTALGLGDTALPSIDAKLHANVRSYCTAC